MQWVPVGTAAMYKHLTSREVLLVLLHLIKKSLFNTKKCGKTW